MPKILPQNINMATRSQGVLSSLPRRTVDSIFLPSSNATRAFQSSSAVSSQEIQWIPLLDLRRRNVEIKRGLASLDLARRSKKQLNSAATRNCDKCNSIPLQNPLEATQDQTSVQSSISHHKSVAVVADQQQMQNPVATHNITKELEWSHVTAGKLPVDLKRTSATEVKRISVKFSAVHKQASCIERQPPILQMNTGQHMNENLPGMLPDSSPRLLPIVAQQVLNI